MSFARSDVIITEPFRRKPPFAHVEFVDSVNSGFSRFRQILARRLRECQKIFYLCGMCCVQHTELQM